jgi:hypothetical protein
MYVSLPWFGGLAVVPFIYSPLQTITGLKIDTTTISALSMLRIQGGQTYTYTIPSQFQNIGTVSTISISKNL